MGNNCSINTTSHREGQIGKEMRSVRLLILIANSGIILDYNVPCAHETYMKGGSQENI